MTNILVSYGSLTVLWTTPQYCRTENKVARLPQRIFDMFIFFAICLPFLRDVQQQQDTQGCRKTAARHARCSYDWRYNSQATHCLTSAARLPQGNLALYRKAVARMPRNARLQCGTRTTYRFVFHLTWDNRTNIVRLPYVRCDSVWLSAICLTASTFCQPRQKRTTKRSYV